MLKFTHCADFHLDFKQYGLQQRYEDYFNTTEDIFIKSKENNVDCIIIAGDIFNSKRPSGESIKRFIEIKNKYKIPVYAIDGNHDKAGHAWLDICGIGKLDKPVEIKGNVFLGIDYCRANQFKEKLIELDENNIKVDVLVMHQAISEMFDFGGGDFSTSWLVPAAKSLGVKYIAMGDIHSYSLKTIDGLSLSYPGSPEPTSVSQLGGTGFINIVTLGDEVEIKKITLNSREFIRVRASGDNTKLIRKIEQGYTPFVIIEYLNGEGLDLIGVLNEHGVMYQTRLLIDEEDSGEEKIVFDRYDAVKYVRQVTNKFFNENTEEYSLTVAILDDPEGGIDIMKEYLKTRGLLGGY